MTVSSAGTTRDRLLDAGERLFAERGYAAVPVRLLVQEASAANGAAVGYYFGSKQGLYNAVVDRVQEPLAEAYRRSLRELEADDQPELEEILDAYLRPLVAMRRADGDGAQARLLAVDFIDRQRRDAGVSLPERDAFRSVLARVLPDVRGKELAWRFEAMHGLVVMHMLGALDATQPRESLDATVARLVRHAAAHLRAKVTTAGGSLT